MDQICLYLLGDVRLEADDQAVSVDTRKALALAAYLALEGKSHSRDWLAAFLWPESDQNASRGALRRTLSALRKAVGESQIEASRDSIELILNRGLWVDVLAFRQTLAEASAHHRTLEAPCMQCLELLQKAASLYRGDFMEGFSLRDSLPFDDWQFQEAEQLRREYSSALMHLVDASLLAERPAEALRYGRDWLATDPLNEGAHRKLIELYARSGQRSAAMRQYRECVRILEAELGVAPMEETQQLYEAVRKDRLPALVPRQAKPVIDPPNVSSGSFRPGKSGGSSAVRLKPPDEQVGDERQKLPLVGREPQLAELRRWYAAVPGQGQLVILRGETGIGKSRLAEDFLAEVRSAGGYVLSARCYEGESSLAYGAVMAALRSGLAVHNSSDWLSRLPPYALQEAARLLPELRSLISGDSQMPPLEGPGGQTRFFDGLAQVLTVLADNSAENMPGVIFIDDLQWADEASASLLSFFANRLADKPVLLLITWQDAGPVQGRHLGLIESVAMRQGIARTIRLERLSPSQVIQLVEKLDLPQAQTSPSWAAQLARKTEGVPFFIMAYVHAGQSKELIAAGESGAPAGVRTLLEARVNMASGPARQILQTAAVVGRVFDFEDVFAASGRSEEETVAALEELETRGLVRELPAAGETSNTRMSYDFNHEQMRLLVYTSMSMARRRLLHRRVAENLIRKQGGEAATSLASQIAYHLREAGQPERAAEYYLLAGKYNRSLYANQDALGYFEAALALGTQPRAQLHLEIGDVQRLLGNYAAALRSYEAAASSSPSSELPVVEHRLGQVYSLLGEWEQAQDHYQIALDGLPDQHSLRIQVLVDWSLMYLRMGDSSKAEQLANQALLLAEHLAEPRSLAQAHNLLGILNRHLQRPALAREHLEQSLSLAEQLGGLSAQAAALNNLALVSGDQGEYQCAQQLAEQALALCITLGDRHQEAAVRSNLADLLRAGGDEPAALEQLKQAVAIFAQIGADTGEWQPEIWKLVEF